MEELEELVKMREEIRELKQIVKDAVAPRYTLKDAQTQTIPEDFQQSEPFGEFGHFGHLHIISAERIAALQEQHRDPQYFAAAILREMSNKFRKILLRGKPSSGVGP